MVEPVNPADPVNPGTSPLQPPSIQSGLAAQHPWMAFDDKGLPNQLLAEQLLASDLGEKVESQGTPRTISLDRLEQIFYGNVLHKDSIDESWPSESQIRKFFDSNSDYITITQNGKYSTLVSRMTVLNTMVKTLVEKKQKA